MQKWINWILRVFDNLLNLKSDHESILGTVKEEDMTPKLDKLSGKMIMIDPGHGLYMKTTNGSGPLVYQREDFDGVREDLITLKISKYLQEELELVGAGCWVTRTPDSKEGSLIDLKKRGELKNITPTGSSNKSKDVNVRWQYANLINNIVSIDLFISIHFNAGGGKGCEIFYYTGNEHTKKIATAIQKETIKANPGLNDRGVKDTTKYAVVKRTHCPSVLWEGAFFDSKYDREKFLKDEEYYKRSAKAIAKGIADTIGNNT